MGVFSYFFVYFLVHSPKGEEEKLFETPIVQNVGGRGHKLRTLP